MLAVSLLKLVGLVGCFVIFMTTFSFTANAPDHQIDERERAERNAAYFRAYQVVITAVFLLFLATIGARLLTDWTPTGEFARLNALLIQRLSSADAAPLWYEDSYFGTALAPQAAKAKRPEGRSALVLVYEVTTSAGKKELGARHGP